MLLVYLHGLCFCKAMTSKPPKISEVLSRMFISSCKTSGFSQMRAVIQNTLMGSLSTRVKVDAVILEPFSPCYVHLHCMKENNKI